MGYSYDFWIFDEESDILSDKKILMIIADYSYFLEKAKMYKKSIEVSKLLTYADSKLTGPYLHLGDSYYHTSNKKKALEAYEEYSKLRKEQGKEERIPVYVKKRINELGN